MGSRFTGLNFRAAGSRIWLAVALIWGVFAQVAVAGCADSAIELRTPANAVMRFQVELAADDASRAQGLMHRPSMPRSSGMLFIYPRPVHAVFWMKNTLIPLDMLFADETGRVTRVHSMAKPLDETPIDGGRDVQFVLEINGGMARRLGLVEGSVMRHPSIRQDRAVWACD